MKTLLLFLVAAFLAVACQGGSGSQIGKAYVRCINKYSHLQKAEIAPPQQSASTNPEEALKNLNNVMHETQKKLDAQGDAMSSGNLQQMAENLGGNDACQIFREICTKSFENPVCKNMLKNLQ